MLLRLSNVVPRPQSLKYVFSYPNWKFSAPFRLTALPKLRSLRLRRFPVITQAMLQCIAELGGVRDLTLEALSFNPPYDHLHRMSELRRLSFGVEDGYFRVRYDKVLADSP